MTVRELINKLKLEKQMDSIIVIEVWDDGKRMVVDIDGIAVMQPEVDEIALVANRKLRLL